MVIAGAGDMASTSTSHNKKKKTQGRKKIDVTKKIQNPATRQVTFSKRRSGLFKKASEICVKTGAQMAIFVISPGGRLYTYGHPDVDILLNRYLNVNNNYDQLISPQEVQRISSEYNRHYEAVLRELEVEKKKEEVISMMKKKSDNNRMCFEKDVNGMNNVGELEEFLYAIMEMKKKVVTKADELMMVNKTPAGLFGPNSVASFKNSSY
uniref:agamous-like MADS-box protein AGL61 n=1 Tax=Erigeron canadensis TaxID=72917 RepID=UPI001CB97187|nr:agamous-like MADS-box protein AGL61 [Erigeron canadensis]